MKQEDLIAALRAQLDDIERIRPLPYDGEERKDWEKRTVQLLRDAFGEDSMQLDEFLKAPLGKFTPNMSRAEWEDNYNYLLRNQAHVLEKYVARAEASGKSGRAHIGVVGRPADAEQAAAAADKTLPKHFLLDPMAREHKYVPETVRTAVLGLENLLRADAPWTDVRQQLFVVLAAERPIAVTVLRALPAGLHLCTRDR